jgi:predicted flavoprotein YhiN
LLTVAARAQDADVRSSMRKGQFVITAGGVEGSLIYALSAALREQINRRGHAVLELDLLPDKSADRVLSEVSAGRGSRSLSSHLQSKLGLDALKIALLHEVLSKEQMQQADVLAATIKQLPLRLFHRVRLMKRSALPVASVLKRSMPAPCYVLVLGSSVPVKCWIGKHLPVVIC